MQEKKIVYFLAAFKKIKKVGLPEQIPYDMDMNQMVTRISQIKLVMYILTTF